MDADLSCKVEGRHLVSFETVDEYNHVLALIQKRCSAYGFWTSARDLGGDHWVWRNSGEKLIDDHWARGQPSGDGDCGNMFPTFQHALNDGVCEREMCYICEGP